MGTREPSSPLEDIEFLARSEHRVSALDALSERPRSRSDLRETMGVSQSTIGRTLRAFEDRRWIRRDGQRYEATQLGAFVAARVGELVDQLETERALRDIWRWLPAQEDGFTIEMCADAIVTVAEADSPYLPVNRFRSLLGDTAEFQFVGFDVALLEPCKDELRQRIIDGMDTVIIDPPSAARYVLSTYREHCSEPLESGNLTIMVHEDLPSYGVSLFDERTAVSGYNPDSGTVQVLIDTDAPEVREWAKSTFESYRREARPLSVESTV